MSVNISDRIAMTRDPTRIVDVYSAADFGPLTLAPDGNMRATLVDGTKYLIHKTFVLPLMFVPKVTSPGAFSFIVFESASFDNMLVNATTGAQFWGRDISAMFFNFTGFIDISNAGAGRGSTLWNLVGGNGNLSVVAGRPYAIVQFKSVGNLVDLGYFYGALSQTFANESGLTLRITPAEAANGTNHFFTGTRYVNLAALPDQRRPQFTIIGATPETAISANLVTLGKAANSFIHIDSASAQGNYNIIGQSYRGVAVSGEFFRPTEVEAISGNAANNLAIPSFSNSTVNPGVDTTVNFGTIVDFVRGQVILIGNEAAYDGLHPIVRVADDQMSFDINVIFSTSGGGDLFQTVHTVANCKFARDETVVITEEALYNGTFQVTSQTDTTFTVPHAFTTSEIATATSTGRDQTSVGVICTANGAQPDSMTLGFAEMNANETETNVAAINTYQAIDVSGLINSVDSERFTLTDATAGVYTYIGLRPIIARVSATPSATKGGATQNYRFTAAKNGTVPTFAAVTVVAAGASGSNFTTGVVHNYVAGDTIVHTTFADVTYNGTFIITAIVSTTVYEVATISFNATGTGLTSVPFAPLEVKSAKVFTTVIKRVAMVTNDTVQIMAAGEGTNDNLTITDFVIEIEA